MKKNLFLALCACACFSLIFTACEKKNKAATDDPISSDDQKDYLMETGQQLINTFDAIDQKAEAQMIEGLYYKLEEYNWDAFETFEDKVDIMAVIPRQVMDVAAGRRSPMASPIIFGIERFAGTFVANDNTQTWEQIQDGNTTSVIARAKNTKGNMCEAKLWGEGEIRTYTFIYYYKEEQGTYHTSVQWSEKYFDGAEKYTITANVPATIRYTFKEESNTIMDVTMNIDMVENDHYNLSGSYQFVNLTWKQSMAVNYTSAKAEFAMYYGNTSLFSAKVNIPTYSINKKSDSQTYEDYAEDIADRWEQIVRGVGSAVAEVDIINRVQIKANISNVGDMFDEYQDWEEKYDDDEMTLNAANKLCDIYNKYCLAGVYYNSDALQAQLKLQPYQRKRGYDIEPVIYFPYDDTSYSFDQFFSENRFGSLIDMAEDMVNKYIKLLKQTDIDPIELR